MQSLDPRTMIIPAMLAIASPAIPAAELSGYVTATTDYVHRGVTQSDGDPAIQLGFDLGFGSGLYFGAWGSTVDISGHAGSQRDHEVDYYIGYTADAGDRWAVGINIVAYTYPGMTGFTDYDYVESALTANYDDTLWFEYAYSPDLYRTGYDTHNYQFYFERPVYSDWLLGGGGGYYDVSRLSGKGYGYWEVGLTRSVNQFEFDLRYHDTNHSVPFISSPDRAKARGAFSVTFSF